MNGIKTPSPRTIALVQAYEDAQAGGTYKRTGAAVVSTIDFATFVELQAETEGKTVEQVLEEFRRKNSNLIGLRHG